MPVHRGPPCCCKDLSGNFCYGCYPNLKVSPITVQIERKPRYPPYPKANVKPINFDDLFPKGPGSTVPVGKSQAGSVPCKRCAKILREKEIQLVRKEQELFQLQRHLRNHGGRKHDYGALREMEFQLRKRDQQLAVLNMEEARLDAKRLMTQTLENRPTCLACAKRLRKKESAIRRIEQEVVRQMASPYIKISPNPCDCCSGAVQPKDNEKKRKKNQNNCWKELNKREKELKKKEKDIDNKIKQFRKENLEEAKENLEKTPQDLIKEVILNCKCACTRTSERKKNIDPCTYNPYAKLGTWACTMPFPMLNSVAPQLHNCSTKCCVLKLLEGIVGCYCRPRCAKKKKVDDTCVVMRLLRWWVFRKSGKCTKTKQKHNFFS